MRARRLRPGRGGRFPQPVPPLPSHLCPPASVDEGADRLVGPRPTGVQVGAVPGFDQPHKVGAFPLQGEESKQPHRHCFTLSVSERAGRERPIPPVVLFLSSDIPLFSWRTPASGSGFSKTDCFRDNRPGLREPGRLLRTMSGSLLTLCMSRATRYSLLPRYSRPWSWSIRRIR